MKKTPSSGFLTEDPKSTQTRPELHPGFPYYVLIETPTGDATMNHNELIEDLTVKAEKGNDISDVLNNMDWQDRLSTMQEMDKKNEEHRKNGSTTSDLIIETKTDDSGRAHATNMIATGRIYNSDVYELPPSVQEGLNTAVGMLRPAETLGWLDSQNDFLRHNPDKRSK